MRRARGLQLLKLLYKIKKNQAGYGSKELTKIVGARKC